MLWVPMDLWLHDPWQRTPNSCKCVVSTPGHVLRNWRVILIRAFLGFVCFPFIQFHISGKQLTLSKLDLIIQSWVLDHGHPSTVFLIFSSFILMISPRPFITAASTRIGEILRAALVNGWIFSGFSTMARDRMNKFPLCSSPKAGHCSGMVTYKKAPWAYGRGGQTY